MKNYLKIQNETLALPAAGVSLSLQNPFFDTENIERLYSMPFNAAMTPQLAHVFKHITRFDALPQSENPAAKLIVGHQEFAKGVFKIQKVSRQNVDGNFETELQNILAQCEEFKLSDILPTYPIGTPKGRWTFTPALPAPGLTYSVNINSQTFSATASTNNPSEIPTILAALYTNISAVFPTLTTETSNSSLILTDLTGENPKISPVATHLTISGNKTYYQSQQENFLAYVKDDLDSGGNPIFKWCRKLNEAVYGEKSITAASYPLNNAVYDAGFWTVLGNTHNDTENWSYTYQPFVTMKYALFYIAFKLQIDGITGDFAEWADIEKLCFDNDCLLDEVHQEWVWDTGIMDFKQKFLNHFVKEINLKNHVPDLTAKEILTNLADWLQLSVHFENNKIVFKKKKAQLSQKPRNWTGRIGRDVSRTVKKPEGFTLKYKAYDGDALQPLPNYVGGGGKIAVELPLSIPNQKDYAGEFVVHSERAATSTAGGLRLFFDNGRIGSHWSGGNSAYDVDGTTLLHSFSLQLTGTKGVYETFRKGVDERQIDGWTATLDIDMSVTDVFQFQNYLNPMIYFFDAENGALTGLIKSVDVRLLGDGVGRCRVEVVGV